MAHRKKRTINYTESKELRSIAELLKARYINIVGYIELDKIFFAFKGGDVGDFFDYETLGAQNDWVKHTIGCLEDAKLYCISMTYDYYQKTQGSPLQWIMLECLYSCAAEMDGSLRRKNVHEFSRIINTLEELGISHDWRGNGHLPELLGEETIVFWGTEDDEEDEE